MIGFMIFNIMAILRKIPIEMLARFQASNKNVLYF
jgi:hypothetical protein